ncbi:MULTISPECIES: hypothetical protein [unclassified Pseudoxanthomonas]|uniref:hypothetical protein n=1 Tax=unclassified Pseudoxanthomonas TaxID=2645906 RepID=UPI003078A564
MSMVRHGCPEIAIEAMQSSNTANVSQVMAFNGEPSLDQLATIRSGTSSVEMASSTPKTASPLGSATSAVALAIARKTHRRAVTWRQLFPEGISISLVNDFESISTSEQSEYYIKCSEPSRHPDALDTAPMARSNTLKKSARDGTIRKKAEKRMRQRSFTRGEPDPIAENVIVGMLFAYHTCLTIRA